MTVPDFDVALVGAVDPDPWLEALSALDVAAWAQMEHRQRRRTVRGAPGVHHATVTLPVLWASPPRFGTVLPPAEIPQHHGHLFDRPLSELRRVLAARYGAGWLLRCIVVNLPAGERIRPHRDNGASFEVSHRCHVAVVTNPQVAFQVGDTPLHMGVGDVWEINNQRRHAVTNGGRADRLHVICDWHPETRSLNAYALS